MNDRTVARVPVSIVCVFNDPEVLETCLARSIGSEQANAPETEFIPVDNRENTFPSAGSALNHGARLAKNDVVVFVHQDVVIHSLAALEFAAGQLTADEHIGILGSVGIERRRRIVGRMRDRVVQIGESTAFPRDVESLDEVLFLVSRDRILREPLSEDPNLAWHAYGVEYSCRMRQSGLRATAVDLPITHNSLTTNLDRLDVAHGKIASMYRSLLPVHTTCGTVYGVGVAPAFSAALRRSRGAAIWLRESLEATMLERRCGTPVVLADIRLIIDDLLTLAGRSVLRVVDATPGASSVSGLKRFGKAFTVEAANAAHARALIANADEDEITLITGIRRTDVAKIVGGSAKPLVIGHWQDTGTWVLAGISRDTGAPLWGSWRNRPLTAGIRRSRLASLAG